jgi:hypothetical protein
MPGKPVLIDIVPMLSVFQTIAEFGKNLEPIRHKLPGRKIGALATGTPVNEVDANNNETGSECKSRPQRFTEDQYTTHNAEQRRQ